MIYAAKVLSEKQKKSLTLQLIIAHIIHLNTLPCKMTNKLQICPES